MSDLPLIMNPNFFSQTISELEIHQNP